MVEHKVGRRTMTNYYISYNCFCLFCFSKYDSNRNCTHIDCDGLQNILIEDIDGSLIGIPSVVLSKEYPSCDIIPRELLTTINGTAIPVEDIAPFLGKCSSKR